MSTAATLHNTAILDRPARSGKGFWARVIEARAAEAQARVDDYLSQLSDERLVALGKSPAEIRALRERPGRGYAAWF